MKLQTISLVIWIGALGVPARIDAAPAAEQQAGPAATPSVSAGLQFSCARLADGRASCWGAGRRVPALVPLVVNLTHLSARGVRACAVDTDGSVICWAPGSRAELVLGPGSARRVEVGRAATCVLTPQGSVRCWRGSLAETWPSPSIDDAIDLSVGAMDACVVRAGGAVVCWGQGQAWGERVAGIRDAVSVSMGTVHACAVTRTGRVSCFGQNDMGQLGDGTRNAHRAAVRVEGIDDAVAVSAGNRHTCALRRSGELLCWGAGYDGALGLGRGAQPRLRPTAVPGVHGAVSIAAGLDHGCAAEQSGRILCWGSNEHGQVGINMVSDAPFPPTPVMVTP